MKFVSVQTLEKIPRAITLTARGVAGHGSVPLQTNSVVHLADAVAKVAKWQPPIRPNETTAAYFKRLATISTPEQAERYRNALSPDPKVSGAADEYLRANEPRHASMLRTSVSPNMFQAGYRVNVIPSEAMATLDVRTLPDEDPAAFLEEVRRVVNDPSVEVQLHRARRAAGWHDAAQHRSLRRHRSQRHEALQDDHAADDEHGRDRHGVSARQGHPVLRHRSGDRHRGRTEGVRRAQRSGADSRKRAVSASSASTTTSCWIWYGRSNDSRHAAAHAAPGYGRRPRRTRTRSSRSRACAASSSMTRSSRANRRPN